MMGADKNLTRLIKYDKLLRIEPAIRIYIDVLLWNLPMWCRRRPLWKWKRTNCL